SMLAQIVLLRRGGTGEAMAHAPVAAKRRKAGATVRPSAAPKRRKLKSTVQAPKRRKRAG
ncbi:MAG TPA: hypothetical protein VGC20_01290, partial [bacterium]